MRKITTEERFANVYALLGDVEANERLQAGETLEDLEARIAYLISEKRKDEI